MLTVAADFGQSGPAGERTEEQHGRVSQALRALGIRCILAYSPQARDCALAQNLEPLSRLVTHRFALDQINQEYATAEDKQSSSIKVHIIPS
jgi:threonine dehydrogenase-like Zn-dependent dehydrogenase